MRQETFGVLWDVKVAAGLGTNDGANDFELVLPDESRLGGLPDSALEAAKQSAQSKNVEGYRFTLQAPSLISVLTYADDRDLRQQLYEANNQRATTSERDNPEVIRQVLRLRAEKARLLGHSHFADLVLEDRMAKRGDEARSFLTRLEEATRERFVEENQALEDFRAEQPEAPEGPMQLWDVAYYAEKLRREYLAAERHPFVLSLYEQMAP